MSNDHPPRHSAGERQAMTAHASPCPHQHCRECAASRGRSICRLCKAEYSPPVGLFFGDPTICSACRERSSSNLVYDATLRTDGSRD